eukprot:TRINITY_DN18419_c0_g1_i7.p1 TRINITY_DN18419_c0_g1~~TRINITY_DN18419_c0_g1_i7.p1  ORF type:complete len:153 (-),score=27.97 TRINITY_DN18419_c0_g1_i7:245-703(-)
MTDSESSSAIPHRQYSGEEAARGSVITVFGDAFRQTGQVDDEADFDLDDEHTSDGGHVARELFQAWGAEEQLHTAHAKLNEKKKQRVKKSSSAMLERLALHQQYRCMYRVSVSGVRKAMAQQPEIDLQETAFEVVSPLRRFAPCVRSTAPQG